MPDEEFQRAGGALSFAQPILPARGTSLHHLFPETQDKEWKIMESQLLPVGSVHK